MHRIIYIDGDLADKLGNQYLKKLAAELAVAARVPVDILTHGESLYHADRRVSGMPTKEEAPTK